MGHSYCAICERRVHHDDTCDGCRELICDTCQVNYPAPDGEHELEQHTGESESEPQGEVGGVDATNQTQAPAPATPRVFYYLHENGSLIAKPPSVLEGDPTYFNSPFVRRVWDLDLGDRIDAWRFLLEASALGANTERVQILADHWLCTPADLAEYMSREKDVTDERRRGLTAFLDAIGVTEADALAEVRKRWEAAG